MLTEITKFSLIPKDNKFKSNLAANGQDTGKKLWGEFVQKQYQFNHDFYLLFTDYDEPYEELLSIYLLGLDYRILDTIFISYHYLSGITATFREIQVLGSRKISFKYETNRFWELTINEKSRLSCSKNLIGAHRPWYRKIGRHYLELNYTGDIEKEFY